MTFSRRRRQHLFSQTDPSALRIGHHYRRTIFRRKLDRTFPRNWTFPSSNGSDLRGYFDPFPSALGSDLYRDMPGSCHDALPVSSSTLTLTQSLTGSAKICSDSSSVALLLLVIVITASDLQQVQPSPAIVIDLLVLIYICAFAAKSRKLPTMAIYGQRLSEFAF